MSEELKPCRQCGGPANVNNYDASIECMDCTYEEGDSLEWNTDRPITKADVDAYLSERGLVAVPEEPTDEMIEKTWAILDQSVYPKPQKVAKVYRAMVAAYKVQAL